jgi:hypothetical protein
MKKTLKSGATLDITRSPFVIGHKLFKTILTEMKGVHLQLGLKDGQSIGSLFDLEMTDEAINTAKNGILTLMSSQDIEDVLWECMPRVLYNNKKIDLNLFEDDRAAEDFLEIFKEVMVVNLAPFRKSLESLFPNFRLLRTNIEDQKSK